MVICSRWQVKKGHVEWDNLLTWKSQVDPRQKKMEVVGWVRGSCNTDKVWLPQQDPMSVEVSCKTKKTIDCQDHFDR